MSINQASFAPTLDTGVIQDRERTVAGWDHPLHPGLAARAPPVLGDSVVGFQVPAEDPPEAPLVDMEVAVG